MNKTLLQLSGLLINLLVAVATPAYAQPFQFDYSMMGPFQETGITNGDGLQETLIDSIYRNVNNVSNAKMRNGLPPTTTDSFVYEAGGMAEQIYGDEGLSSISPYFEFSPEHRIEAGIMGTRASGLTTGHSSPLPNAWGGDEFYNPEPWRMLDPKTGISVPTIAE